MNQLPHLAFSSPAEVGDPIIVVGAGPTGLRFVREMQSAAPNARILLFGGEPWAPYNRIRLTPLLAGDMQIAGLHDGYDLPPSPNISHYANCPIVAIDRDARCVIDSTGRRHRYGALVLATGSRPHMPLIPGIDLPGVYSFRDLTDVASLLARTARSRRAVVIGGGLLGLEAARGLRRRGLHVTIVEHATRLMARQLDEGAARLLAERIAADGIEVITGDTIRYLLGIANVSALELASGRDILCDTVVVAAGIKPNVDLALQAGLSIGRGIRVDDSLRTSDPLIFAIGECAEHRGIVYGLAAPGFEQAAIAARIVAKVTPPPTYVGSLAATKLKAAGMTVFSIGETGEDTAVKEFTQVAYCDAGAYRKLTLHRGRLIGAMAVGDWSEIGRAQEAVLKQRRLWPWQLWRFRTLGRIWPEASERGVQAWPADATVCNCTGVTAGRLREAIANDNCRTVEALARRTGASTVCGSCRPLLGELVGGSAAPPPAGKGWPLLAGGSLAAALITAVIAFMTPWPVSPTVIRDIAIDALWLDGTLKQVSGFTLLGLSVLSLMMSLRKRWRLVKFGAYAWWRILHAMLGLLTLIVLSAHTGFRLGANLNQVLIVDFLLLTAVGAITGGIASVEHRLPAAMAASWRKLSARVHLLLSWPLPALLSIHILSVYYF